MLFSVLMCINRDNPYVDDAIASILEQDFNDFEFIIVANNCTNKFYDKLNRYGSPNIRLYRTKIGQLSFNLNYGVNLCEGSYIVRMDSDDISKKNRLSVLERAIQENNYPDVIGSKATYINEYGERLGTFNVPLTNDEIRKQIVWKNCFIHPATAIKVKTLISLGGYLGGFNSEDYELWLRFCRNKNLKLINIDEELIDYRITEEQSRGNLLPYAEVTGHMIKEFILTKKPLFFCGFLLAFFKSLFFVRKK